MSKSFKHERRHFKEWCRSLSTQISMGNLDVYIVSSIAICCVVVGAVIIWFGSVIA